MLALLQAAADLQSIARDTAQFIIPEAIITLFACAALVLDVMLPRERRRTIAWVSLAGIGLAFVSLILQYVNVVWGRDPRTGFFNMIVADDYATVFKIIF